MRPAQRLVEVMLMAKNKTSIKVTAVFDGELDATDVFVSMHGNMPRNIIIKTV